MSVEARKQFLRFRASCKFKDLTHGSFFHFRILTCFCFDRKSEDQEDPPSPKKGEVAQSMHFRCPWAEKELCIDVEPYADEVDDCLSQKYAQLMQQPEDDPTEDMDLGEVENLVSSTGRDEHWAAFQNRLSRAPTQCIRYCYEQVRTHPCLYLL